MLQPVLTILKNYILEKNPKTFVKGYAGARQYDSGKIVIYDAFEGEFAGLQDTKNNYFYIRYKDNITLDIAEERSTSCTELEGVSPFRLVAWVYNADIEKLTQALLNDIMMVDFFSELSTTDKKKYTDLAVLFESIELDPEEIYKEETGVTDSNKIKLVKNAVLVAIDFGIKFNYKSLGDDCIDRNICDSC